MRPNRKIRVLLITGLLLLVTLLIAVSYFSSSSQLAAEIVPHPNGYDDFVAAGKLLTGDAPDRKTATLSELQAYLATNQPALERARLGLTKDCASPTVYTTNYIESLASSLSPIKGIAVTFCLVGRKAELEGRPEEAAQVYLSTFKIGTGLSRNALLIDALVSIAIESIGSSSFEGLIPKLTAAQCRTNLIALEKIYRDQEPFALVIIHENRFTQSYPFNLRIQEMIVERAFHPGALVQKKTKVKYDAQLLKLLLLEKNLADRAFELEQGHPPAKWNDIVPAYLPAIPTDPATGQALPFNF